MKTITLDEVAYNRLKAWKRSSKDSFSQVVKRVVPQPGTLAAFLSFVETQQTGNPEADDVMEAAISERNTVKEDPWTT